VHRTAADGDAPDDPAGVRLAVEHLASFERGSCSEGERRAAEWIAGRLGELGCDAAVEEERSFASYAPALGALGVLAVGAGLAGLRTGRRVGPALICAACAAGIADDACNGPRVWRRLVMRRKPTWNAVAVTGDRAAERTLVVLAHHDAHPTSFIFDQRLERALARRFPRVFGGGGTTPFWYPIVAAPALIGLGVLARSHAIARVGFAGTSLSLLAAADLARNRIVPGANDNLSAVGGLLALAHALAERPAAGVRVMLVSCGSEEVLQGGIYGFLARHRAELPPESTSFLNFELLGARNHALLEGEGPLWIEDYTDPAFRDRVERAASRAGIPLRRGIRSHVSTDSVVPSRRGYATATLITLDDQNMIPNYHLMTDTPENVDYTGVLGGARIAEALVHEIAGDPAPSGEKETMWRSGPSG
jgi:hypothetical protein